MILKEYMIPKRKERSKLAESEREVKARNSHKFESLMHNYERQVNLQLDKLKVSINTLKPESGAGFMTQPTKKVVRFIVDD